MVFCESSNTGSVMEETFFRSRRRWFARYKVVLTKSKSEILDVVCAMRSFENINEEMFEEWLQSGECGVGFQHQTDRHCQ
jgi:hypothetical protein